MGGLDVIVFTAGIGENSPLIRKVALQGLEQLGIIIDHNINDDCYGKPVIISESTSRVKILVIPTNEELVIAQDTLKLII